MKCFARLFFISLISGLALIFYNCSESPKEKTPHEHSHEGHNENHKEVTTTFLIEGLSCSSCKNSLEGTLQDKNKFPQIHSARVDLENNTCTVVHDSDFSLDDLKKAVHSTKFRVLKVVP